MASLKRPSLNKVLAKYKLIILPFTYNVGMWLGSISKTKLAQIRVSLFLFYRCKHYTVNLLQIWILLQIKTSLFLKLISKTLSAYLDASIC